MKSGDIVLTLLPPFDDVLVCGISSQIRQRVPDFDELIEPNDADFARSGLSTPSIVRLGFLATVPQSTIKGRIGTLVPDRVALLLKRLAERLANSQGR